MTELDTSGIIDQNLYEEITGVQNPELGEFYPIGKLDAHLNDVPHLAVSIFVFDNGRLLLQQRAATKYHSGGLWANTVCSHPQWQESSAACAQRRLQEELGWQVPLEAAGSIRYRAQVGELFENEYVQCFIGRFDSGIDVTRFNPDEVQALAWLSIPDILDSIEHGPEHYTEWFKIYMAEHRQMIAAYA